MPVQIVEQPDKVRYPLGDFGIDPDVTASNASSGSGRWRRCRNTSRPRCAGSTTRSLALRIGRAAGCRGRLEEPCLQVVMRQVVTQDHAMAAYQADYPYLVKLGAGTSPGEDVEGVSAVMNGYRGRPDRRGSPVPELPSSGRSP